jgi:hypothetical protein
MTESAIYFFFKLMNDSTSDGTFKGMFELYGGSFMWALPVILGSSAGLQPLAGISWPKVDFSLKVWLPMILFNTFIGFTGYAMRFAAIPMVSTLIFSTLNFVGVVAAYLFGYLFQGEKPSWMAVGGAAAIIVANVALVSNRGAGGGAGHPPPSVPLSVVLDEEPGASGHPCPARGEHEPTTAAVVAGGLEPGASGHR